MRILITADLHYDVARSREPARGLAQHALTKGGDVLVLVGDSAGRDPSVLRDCMRLFADFNGLKLLVPGNHCLWSRDGESSLDRYERVLPDLAVSEGFEVLDHRPVVLDSVGLIGSIGWYDYSLRDESLGIPLGFYRAKVSPGAAACLAEHRDLVERYRDELTDRQLSIVTRWMDGQYVKLGMSDEEFLEILTEKLTRQLTELAGEVRRIVVFLHHLPFGELVPQNRPDHFAFAAAYMGSRRLGEVLTKHSKVTDVYCGHSHWRKRQQIGHMSVINIGSTYTEKRLEILEL